MTKKAKRLDSRQHTKGQTLERTDVPTIREQQQRDKQMKLCEKYKGDAADVEEILSVAIVNNEDRIAADEDSNNDASETDSFCRHCLRPQSELQLRYMRPRQRSKLRQQQQAKRERSKQRFSSYFVGSGSGKANTTTTANQAQKARSKKSRSKSRAKRARNNKNPSCSNSNNNHNKYNKEEHLKLPLIRDLNAANEQAIRFRCPQVGPQVGRDRQMPHLVHFHHPQHVQKQLTAYQVQYTHVYEQHLQQQRFTGQQVISPMQTTTLSIESELKQQQQHHQENLHHYHHHQNHLPHHHHHGQQHNEHLSNHQKSNKNQLQRHVTSLEDLTATNNNLQNFCSSSQWQNQQKTHRLSPQCTSDCRQQRTFCCYYCSCCSNTAMTTASQLHNQPELHHYPHYHHQQHHKLPQLPLTHPETASATSVASLDATTLMVTATCTNASIQVLPSISLPLAEEQRNQNFNNPSANEDDPSNLVAPTTPDSPSLVKVSTWYTVAKRGVSC